MAVTFRDLPGRPVDSFKRLFCRRFSPLPIREMAGNAGTIFRRVQSLIAAIDRGFGDTLGHGRTTNRGMLQYRLKAIKIAPRGTLGCWLDRTAPPRSLR